MEEKIEVLIREEDNLKNILTKNVFGKNKLNFFKKEGKKKTTQYRANKIVPNNPNKHQKHCPIFIHCSST